MPDDFLAMFAPGSHPLDGVARLSLDWLLKNTETSISAVAAETGFSSQSHLTSALKSRTGETPYELRQTSRISASSERMQSPGADQD